MSKGPLLHSPQPQERASPVCPTCIWGTYPRHVLHEDGQSLLGTVPQAAIVLHYALVLQVLQQLDLALQCTHLLGERPSCHLGFQGPGSTCLGSAQLALVSGLRGICLPWELQLEKRGDSQLFGPCPQCWLSLGMVAFPCWKTADSGVGDGFVGATQQFR